ncbi:MAG: hypothetical protein CME20_16375, partial [Gemmatimonadetes bacterium]|nr:hypothetical protein [Gemmatimonadota bacterium]
MHSTHQITDPEWDNVFREDIYAEERLEVALGRIPIFGLLSPRELRLVGSIVHIRTFKRGEIILHRGVEQS